MNPEYSEPAQRAPKFPWFSKGVLILAIVAVWSVWVATKPPMPGNGPIEWWEIIAWLAMLILVGAGWQWLRYRDFKKKVVAGTWGQPSGWARFFAPKPTYIGAKGGRYTVSSTGKKIYKKRR